MMLSTSNLPPIRFGDMPLIDRYNLITGTLVTLMTSIFGAYWYVFAAYFICMVFDYITGWLKARLKHNESSSMGLRGIVKKLCYWIIIAVAFLIAEVFTRMGADLWQLDLSFLELLGWFTLACLMINEVRSILENLVECGIRVPEILIKGLAVAEKLINKEHNDFNGKDVDYYEKRHDS